MLTGIRLKKVILIVYICSSNWFENYWCIWPNQKADDACTTCWSGWSFWIDCNVRRNHYSKSAIPRLRFYPIDCVKYCISAAITSIYWGNPFNIIITTRLKKAHQYSLSRLCFIYYSFSSNFKSANILWLNIIFV